MIVGNVNLASNRDYNHGVVMGYKQGAVASKEHGDPSFSFHNLSFYDKNNQ